MIDKLLILLRKNWLYFIPAILLLIFIVTIWDTNYYIGGDFIFPLKPQDNILKTLSFWDEINGGAGYFKYVLILWEAPFYVLSLIGVPSYLTAKIIIVALYTLSFGSMYLLYQSLFKGTVYESSKMALFAAIIFLLNPAALLMIVGTYPLYGIPICLYFLSKFLDTKNILYGILFSFFVNISFFPDLPQAKLLIVFILACGAFLLIYKTVRKLSIFSLLKPLIVLCIITFLLNAFLLVPFIKGMIGTNGLYSNYTSAVTVYNGDADLLSASLLYITRFYNSNLVNKNSYVGQYLGNPVFIIWTFFLLISGLISTFLVKGKTEKTVVYISLFAFVLFIFIAKGANPPFGEIYRWLLGHVPVFKIFRTTATVIIGAVFFYSLLVTLAVYHLSKRWNMIFYLFLIIHIVLFYPIYLGYKIETHLGGNVQQKGVTIPPEYLQMGDVLDRLPDDGKILILPLNDGYISKDWGYFGQSPIPWLTKKPLIANNSTIDKALDSYTKTELCSFTSQYNVRYLLQEKDTTSIITKKDIAYPGKKMMENQYFRLSKTDDSCFSPHVYIPKKTIYYTGDTRQIPALSYIIPESKQSFITKDQTLLKKSDAVVVEKSASNNIIDVTAGYSNLDLGEDALIRDVFYPSVSVVPSSPLYPLILWKEEAKLKANTPGTRELLDQQIIAALKRISEIDRWGVGNSWWKDSQTRYKDTIEQAIHTATISEHPKENLELVYEYLEKCNKKIREISTTQPFWDKQKINSFDEMFSQLKGDTLHALHIPRYDSISYTIDVPEKGEYHAYIIGNHGEEVIENTQNISVRLNDLELPSVINDSIHPHILDAGVLSLDAVPVNMELQFSRPQNLIDNSKWIKGDQVNTVTTNDTGIVFAPNQQNSYYISTNQIAYQQVNKWKKGETYLLRIRHKDSSSASLRLMVREKRDVYDRSSDSWISKEGNIIDEHLNTLTEGGESKVLLQADKNATNAWIYLYVEGGSVSVENVTLEKVVFPHIFLVKTHTSNDNSVSTPPVKLTKLNSTKYSLRLTSNKPTFMVFSEGFDPAWNIHSTNGSSLSNQEQYLANGYANAWYIDPAKIDTKDLVIEYTPQQSIYLGQKITFLSLGGCLVYFFYTIYKKKRYNTNRK